MSKRAVAVIVLSLAASAQAAEALIYELYEVSGGARTLLAEGVLGHSPRDIVAEEHLTREDHWWTKELPVAHGFSAGADIYQPRRLDGFGLWLKDRESMLGRITDGGYSFEWFERERGDVYRFSRGPGRVRVHFTPVRLTEEIAAIEVLEDVTLGLNRRPWFLYMFNRAPTHELVLRKGTVLRFAPDKASAASGR